MPDWVAVISDIHGNLPALDAVLSDIEAQGVTERVCLGDVVGYGPNPGECVERLRYLDFKVIKGNHDAYAAEDGELPLASRKALESIPWTRSQLTPDQRRWLGELPMTCEGSDWQAVHSSLHHPDRWGYVLIPDAARLHLDRQNKKICFIGHSHIPKMFVEGDSDFLHLTNLEDVRQDRKQIINVGSVGQPRDDDPRACYLLYRRDHKDVWWRRVSYGT